MNVFLSELRSGQNYFQCFIRKKKKIVIKTVLEISDIQWLISTK